MNVHPILVKTAEYVKIMHSVINVFVRMVHKESIVNIMKMNAGQIHVFMVELVTIWLEDINVNVLRVSVVRIVNQSLMNVYLHLALMAVHAITYLAHSDAFVRKASMVRDACRM